jgi:hypothetical protein
VFSYVLFILVMEYHSSVGMLNSNFFVELIGMGDLIGIVLIVGYAAGVWKFWSGFRKTNFNQSLSNRLSLSLLWPALYISNKSYRQNFRKALKG